MPVSFRFSAALFSLFLVLAGGRPAAAQDPAPSVVVSDSASAVAQSSADLDKANAELDRIREQVEAHGDDDLRLVDLKVQAEAANRSILAISVAIRPRLDDIKARQTELGDPPAEGAAPEADIVAEERKRLSDERNAINALTAEAENLSIKANKLSNMITEIRRELFSGTLLKRTDVNSSVLSDASGALVAEADDLKRTLSSWIRFVWNYKRGQLFGAVFLSLCAALVFLSGSNRLFSPLIQRPALEVRPDYITRLSVAFWSTMIPTSAVAAFLGSSYFFLDNFNVLRPDIAPIVSLTLAVTVALTFVSLLANAVLAPKEGSWRLVNVSNHGARLLVFAIVAMALANGFDFLFGGISEALGSPVVLTVAKSFVASVLIGLILVAMAFIRPVLSEGEDRSAAGRPWPRLVRMLFIATGLGLFAASLLGYIGLARFVGTQIVMTGAIVVTMYIGVLSGKAVSKQNAFADTIFGRGLEKRFGFGQVALDQAGLFAGLGIYALLIVFFIPLILLQWGFQIADIESWAYRVFTEIKIGSISISLVAIFGGILLFAAGMIITRWFQKWLDGNVMARSHVDPGVRNSVKTGIGYLGVGIAGLIGISAAGLDLSSFALVAGALSLGVGFGLQNIVSNFVSGLILLVERPFKVGDWVVTGTTEGYVKRISVRATEIETFQRQSIMVPNSLFINASVGNWTHRNKLGRADISVHVGYDSDPRRVMEILHEIAEEHPLVLRNPAPMAVFNSFGETTMTFELRVYLADLTNAASVRNDIRLSIFERFRDEGLGVLFKQAEAPVSLAGESLPEPGTGKPLQGEGSPLETKEDTADGAVRPKARTPR
ncbi:MAG: mechanosensitive ion channel family protein [Pararhizobium sp.]|nr:mechanosensitive ion channel family protein [Pararhizobium sp.]MDO9418739.1 mechanosensitive ion channel family protein [Pararhizobium sp.]